MFSLRTPSKPSTVHVLALSLLFLSASAVGADAPSLVPTAITDCPVAEAVGAPMCRVAVPSMAAGWKAAVLKPNASETHVALAPRSGLKQAVVLTDSLSSVEPLVVYRVSASGRQRGGNSLRVVKRSSRLELIY